MSGTSPNQITHQEGVAKVQRRIVRVEVNQLLAHAKRRADYRTRPETDVEKLHFRRLSGAAVT